MARREASAAIQGAQEAPKLSRADAIEGRLARRDEGKELIVVDLTGTGAQDAAIGQVAWDKLGN